MEGISVCAEIWHPDKYFEEREARGEVYFPVLTPFYNSFFIVLLLFMRKPRKLSAPLIMRMKY